MYIIIHAYTYYVFIYIYIYIYIYSNSIILQAASYCAADCRRQPTLYHLKGVALICHRLPQPATGCHRPPDPEPFPTPPWP